MGSEKGLLFLRWNFFKKSGLYDDQNHPIEKKNQGGRREEKKYSEVLSVSSLISINGFQIQNEGLVLGRSKQFVHANRRKEVIYVDTDLSKLVDMVLAIFRISLLFAPF